MKTARPGMTVSNQKVLGNRCFSKDGVMAWAVIGWPVVAAPLCLYLTDMPYLHWVSLAALGATFVSIAAFWRGRHEIAFAMLFGGVDAEVVLVPVAVGQLAIVVTLATSPRFTTSQFYPEGLVLFIGTAGMALVVIWRRWQRKAIELQRELEAFAAESGIA